MWEQIRSNQLRSTVLAILLGLLLLALGYFIGLYFFNSGIAGLVIALIVWLILWAVAYFQGDSIMLSVAGAKKINQADHPRLFNVVEEMKIASGLPKLPDIYIIDDPALNAFATGRDPEHASVAITSGLLQKLNRDELQGVMAHEIGHIKNRDILLMMIAGVMVGTIIILARYAQLGLFFGGGSRTRRDSRDSGGGGGQVIILVVALVLMILAPIAAQVIYFAISRKREYLADASGALYTRYPEGLASALEKIGASTTPLKSANQATAPMYISNPFRKSGMSVSELTATHPPIADRIRVLRAMGGAGYQDYEQAYKKFHSGGVVPQTSAKAVGAVPITQTKSVDSNEPVERARDTTNALWNLNKYKTIDCECGTRLRVPPNYGQPSIQCPHCGRTHQLQ